MLLVVRTAVWRGLPRKKSWIAGTGQAKRSNSDCSTIARLSSAATGLPCGSVVLTVTSISSPGRTGPLASPLRFVSILTRRSRWTVKGLEAVWKRRLGCEAASDWAARTSVITAAVSSKLGARRAVIGISSLFAPRFSSTSL